MSNSFTNPIIYEREIEQLRQESETFNQNKRHDSFWFFLRIIMGYSAIILLFIVIGVSSYILFKSNTFPVPVVIAAGSALLVDVVGLVIAVWKIALNPAFSAGLRPVTVTK